MDFKTKNKNISHWPDAGEKLRPFPYNFPRDCCVFEMYAPDRSTIFLGLAGKVSEDEQYLTSYLIEAPRNCPMRRAFEFGEITWAQYWTHKPWLIEWRYEFGIDGGALVRYIEPHELDEVAREYISIKNHQSPMSLKLRVLEDLLDCAIAGEPIERYIKDLAEFREAYPEIKRPSATIFTRKWKAA